MSEPVMLVGCAGLPVDASEYASELTFLEDHSSFVSPPEPADLPGGRDLARALVAWQVITHPRRDHDRGTRSDIPEHAAVGHFERSRWTDEAWDRMDALARAVRAPAIVFRTPASFTPTAAHTQRLENFVAHADRPGLELAWEWTGTWRPEQALGVCERLGLLPVIDPIANDVPDAEVVYLRVTRKRGSTSETALARLADRVRGRDGFLVFDGPASWEDARRLVKML
jgi:uncharacterized protein YecE (DUF72 family)